jgi:hypothetical protein
MALPPQLDSLVRSPNHVSPPLQHSKNRRLTPCSIAEVYTGIICACLPILKVFCKHHFPSIFAGEDQLEGPAFSTGPGTGNQVTAGFTTHTDFSTSVAGSEERGDVWFGREMSEKRSSSLHTKEFGGKEEGSSASASGFPSDSTPASTPASASASAVSVQQPKEEHVSSG